MDYILLILWFFILIKCAWYLVNWSTNIAKKLGISNLVIGLTIVAFWTSAPEIFVNTMSAIKWETWLALWNIVGSNIANILLILWVSSIIYPLRAKNSTVFKEVPFILVVSLALFFLWYDVILWKSTENIITIWDSLVLILFLIIFLSYTFWIMENLEEEQIEHSERLPNWKAILYIIWWIIWLSLWAKVIVDASINIASSFGISETVIWLTILAIWTSLPELATSIMASINRESDIVIWNVVWSNIINIVIWLSLAWLISPIYIKNTDIVYIYIEVAVTAILMWFLYFSSWKWRLQRWHWIIFVTLYVIYLAFIWFNM